MAVIGGVSLTVPDLDAAVRFYREALGFELDMPEHAYPAAFATALGLAEHRIRGATVRLGGQRLEFLAFDPPGRPYPAASTASDLWFQHCAIVVSDMAAAHERVAAFGVEAITEGGPQRLPPNTGAVTAWKFRDLFGHPLELLHLPDGVGDPTWHRPDGALFQGIDHTAIAVSDAAASIAFYSAHFGFTVSARTHNHGPEQRRLDAIAGADVEVVALSPAGEPPHLELLAYRTGERRPRPAGATAADVASSRIMIEESRQPAAAGQGVGPDRASASGRVRLLSDPNGHLITVQASGAL